MESSATCTECGTSYTVDPAIQQRYPGWTPSKCRSCHGAASSTPSRATSDRRARASRRPGSAATSAVPHHGTGVFTDGSAVPNPGPGGWGVVWVIDDVVKDQASGRADDTTNNRMELQALIEAVRMVPAGTAATLYSDSNLAVRTINEWAAGWERRGWKRKTGPVENLDLVRELHELVRQRPELQLEWIKAHVGHRWNEYADRLAAGEDPGTEHPQE